MRFSFPICTKHLKKYLNESFVGGRKIQSFYNKSSHITNNKIILFMVYFSLKFFYLVAQHYHVFDNLMN